VSGTALPSPNTLNDPNLATVNPLLFTPTREPGSYVAVDPDKTYSPLDFFRLLFTDDLVAMICANSNKYAEKHKDRLKFTYARYPGLVPPLLLHLVGLFIYFGLQKLPLYEDYWTTTRPVFTLYGRSFAGRGILSRNRFRSIWAFLHISDPDREDSTDRLSKVRPMLDNLNELFQRYFQPGCEISIDALTHGKIKGTFSNATVHQSQTGKVGIQTVVFV